MENSEKNFRSAAGDLISALTDAVSLQAETLRYDAKTAVAAHVRTGILYGIAAVSALLALGLFAFACAWELSAHYGIPIAFAIVGAVLLGFAVIAGLMGKFAVRSFSGHFSNSRYMFDVLRSGFSVDLRDPIGAAARGPHTETVAP